MRGASQHTSRRVVAVGVLAVHEDGATKDSLRSAAAFGDCGEQLPSQLPKVVEHVRLGRVEPKAE